MQIWNEIFSNLWLTSLFAVILACLIIANIVSGMYYSIGGKNQQFDSQKLLAGILKGVAVLVASFLIAIALTAVPYVFAASGIPIDATALQSISIVILFVVWGAAIFKYALAALDNLRKIFGINTTTKT